MTGGVTCVMHLIHPLLLRLLPVGYTHKSDGDVIGEGTINGSTMPPRAHLKQTMYDHRGGSSIEKRATSKEGDMKREQHEAERRLAIH